MTMTLALNPDTNDLILTPLPSSPGLVYVSEVGQSLSSAQYTSGPDEVGQRVLVTLQHFYGEYFLNLPGGVPWLELILGGKDYKLAEAILRQVVLNVPGVLSIVKFDAAFSNRKLSIQIIISANGTDKGIPVFFNTSNLYKILDGGLFGTPRPQGTIDGGSF